MKGAKKGEQASFAEQFRRDIEMQAQIRDSRDAQEQRDTFAKSVRPASPVSGARSDPETSYVLLRYAARHRFRYRFRMRWA